MWHCAAAGASPPSSCAHSDASRMGGGVGGWGIKASWFGELEIMPFIRERLLQGSPPRWVPVVSPLKVTGR